MLLLATHSTAAALLAIGIIIEALFPLGLAALILTMFWIQTFYTCLVDPIRHFRFTTLIGSALAISYFLGASPQLLFATGARNLRLHSLHPDILAMTIIYIASFSLILLAVSRFEAPRVWRSMLTSTRYLPPRADLMLLIYAIIVTMFQLFFLLSGEWNYMGLDLDKHNQVPIGPALTMFLASPITAVAGWVFGRRRRIDMLTAPFSIILCLQVVWWMIGGRRLLTFQLMCFVIFWIWGSRSKPSLFVLSIVALPLLIGLNQASKYFLGIRYVTWSYYDTGTIPPATELLSKVVEIAQRQSDLLDDLNKENLSGRSFVLGYAYEVIGRLEISQIEFGNHVRQSVLRSIPRVLFPDKEKFISNTMFEEYRLDPKIGLPEIDRPWSLAVAAYADFMILGIIIYPAFMLVLGVIVVYIIKTYCAPTAQLCGIGIVLFTCMQAETAMTNYFTLIRFLVMLMPIFIVARLIAYSARRTGLFGSGHERRVKAGSEAEGSSAGVGC